MSLNRQHPFWGSLSPLGGLTGASLLIMASARLSWAIVVSGCLLWVYGLSALTVISLTSFFGMKVFPKNGRKALYVCIASFWSTLYILLFWLLCPLAALEVFMLLLLVPLFFTGSNIIEHLSSMMDKYHYDNFEYLSEALVQAAVLAALTLVFSIIREPLFYCSWTLPGTYKGMITVISFKEGSFFPIEIFSASAGALILLGYIICLYQFAKSYISAHGDN
ncbi:MAG: hypothetical protein LBI12_05705 [Treponema sp.]|jgi:hypothetical protein|nr:hypothetical protein [Treponema sp.]